MIKRQKLSELPISNEIEQAIMYTCQVYGRHSKRFRQQATKEVLLRYYFGGQTVICLKTVRLEVISCDKSPTEDGPLNELGQAYWQLSKSERATANVYVARPWNANDFVPNQFAISP